MIRPVMSDYNFSINNNNNNLSWYTNKNTPTNARFKYFLSRELRNTRKPITFVCYSALYPSLSLKSLLVENSEFGTEKSY